MKNSSFQFSNPRLKVVTFEVNDDFNADEFDGIVMSTETETLNIDANHSVVSLQLTIGKAENQPFKIHLQNEADFEWNDELTNEQINDLLRINGAAVLYSYLRPIVSNLTNNSALPVLNLPFIDFTESK